MVGRWMHLIIKKGDRMLMLTLAFLDVTPEV